MRKVMALFTLLALMLSLCACSKKVEEPTWQEQFDMGVRYLSEGNYEEAILTFTAAIEIDPMQAEAYEKLAEAYLALGDTDAALQVLRDGLAATGDARLQARIDELTKPEPTPTPEPTPEPTPTPTPEPTPGPTPEPTPTPAPTSTPDPMQDFTIENGVLVKYTGSDSAVTIPDGVTRIAQHAFSDNGVASITIPSTVSTIDLEPFWLCQNLTSLSVNPDNPHFSSTNGVVFNKNCTSAICSPTGLTGHYAVPEGVVGLAQQAFCNCKQLTGVTLPSSLTSIGDLAFNECSRLTDVALPSNVTTVGWAAFMNCSSLTGVTIPSGVGTVSQQAFSGCTSLSNLTIQNGVKHIGKNAFSRCTNLLSVTIPGSVSHIGSQAFFSCGLVDVTISHGVTNIEQAAFQFCSNLTTITIPDSVSSAASNIFDGCDSLTDIYYSGTENQWAALNVDVGVATVHFGG